MKRMLLLFTLMLFSGGIFAQYQYDTVYSFKAGPGVTHTRINVQSVPWRIYIMEVDLKNPSVKLETVKSGDKLGGALESVRSMTAKKNSDGHYVIGAVNGDFFSGNNSLQMQVKNGEIFHKQRTDGAYASVAFNLDNSVEFTSPVFSGSVTVNGASMAISGVNETRTDNKIILYNSLYGAYTGTSGGSEVMLHPLGEWFVNDTVSCVVDSVSPSSGYSPIAPNGGIVLSATGSAGTFLTQNMHKGDIVKVFTKATSKLKKLKELIGGHPFIMKNGALAPIDPNDPMLNSRNPRTIAGINKDTTKLFIVVIDGRQPVLSAGMDVWETVDYLKTLGIYEAINFDGGGSTTMVVRNSLINSPSDGSERYVGNSLMVVSTQKAGPVNKIVMYPQKIKVYKGEKQRFTILGSDQNDNPAAIDSTLLQCSSPQALGTIDNLGNFTAASKAASGYIYVKYKNFTDSVFVQVKSVSRILLSPKTAVTDIKKPLQLAIKGYDIDNLQRTVSPLELNWKSTNPSVAAVDSLGTIYGKSEGNVKIIASADGNISDTVDVSIQVGKGTNILSDMENLSSWKVTGLNIDTSATKISLAGDKTQGSSSLKIDYKFTYNPSVANYVYLDTNIPIYGVPDTLFIDSRSDSTAHRLFLIVSNGSGDLFRVSAYGYINTPDKFNQIPIPMKTFAALGSGIFNYPGKITRLEIWLQYNNSKRVSGQTYSGTIYLDNLRAKYPEVSTKVEETSSVMPKDYALSQNYPNPFNPSTNIGYSIPESGHVRLRIYDILGNEITTLVNDIRPAGTYTVKFNAGSLPSGMYIYRIEAGRFTSSKKLLLIK